VLSAAFSLNEVRVVTAWSSILPGPVTARLRDAATGVALGPPLRHEEPVLSAAFSPDGTRVVTASYDHTARLWNVKWPQGPITAVACALLRDRDIAGLAERYGIVIREPICGPDMPAPDLSRLDRQ
jgi:hypothetical protein